MYDLDRPELVIPEQTANGENAAIVAVPVRQVVRSKTAELGHTAVSETITR